MSFPAAAKNFAIVASGRCSEISGIAYVLHYQGDLLTQDARERLVNDARAAIGDLFAKFCDLDYETQETPALELVKHLRDKS